METVAKTPSIIRQRYVVMRNNRTEIWCGLSKNFHWKPLNSVADASVKTYRSEAQAKAGYSGWDDDIEIIPVVESIVGI